LVSCRVLLVDDDPAFRARVGDCLSREGFCVSEATTGNEGLRLARATRFDLIVLEMTLSGLDGTTLCRQIRSQSANRLSAVLFASSRSNEDDKVKGFACGADDYVAKTIGFNEFLARVRAVLRRSRYATADPSSSAGDDARPPELIMDIERRRVAMGGPEITLSRQEFDLLYILSSRPGIVFSRKALLAKLPRMQSGATERTVDAIVTRLRQRLGDDSRHPQFIFTVWGLGYKFADAEGG
jgi:DNA-binding response OmpR family regulator